MDGDSKHSDGNEEFRMTELFLAMADMERTYVGTLKRESIRGVPVFRGSVIIEGTKVLGAASDLEKLYHSIDDMCVLILDHGVHEQKGKTMEYHYGELGMN